MAVICAVTTQTEMQVQHALIIKHVRHNRVKVRSPRPCPPQKPSMPDGRTGAAY